MSRTDVFVNETAEDQLLGSLLLNESSAVRIIDRIRPELFHSDHVQKEFLQIRDLIDRHGTVEISEAAGAVGFDRANELMQIAGNSGSGERLLFLLNQCYESRILFKVGHDICVQLKQGTTPEEIQDSIIDPYLCRNDVVNNSTGVKMSDLVDTAFNELGQIDKIGIKSGFEKIDYLLNGFKPGSLTVIGARPSDGKSSLLHCMILNIGHAGKRIALFTMEEPSNDVVKKMMLKESEVSLAMIHNDVDNATKKVMGKIGEMRSMHITLYDLPKLTIPFLRKELKRMQRIGEGFDIVFIDYLQLMSSSTKTSDKVTELDGITQELKNIAMEFNIPIIAAAQLNRDAEGKLPTMAHLRGSGGIEQAADNVLLIDRSDEEATGTVGIIVAKQRSGIRAPYKPIQINWLPAFAKFTDAGVPHESET